MARITAILSSCAILGLAAAGFARTKVHEDPLDSSKGVKLSSRIPCDGATNPEDQVKLVPTFSQGDFERAFRVNIYEETYCKRVDLGFKCLEPGHNLWKEELTVDSSKPEAAMYGVASCSETGVSRTVSKDTPQIVLTGWYKEPGTDPKRLWKQAEVKKVESRWETYEFATPDGETARIEIDRR